MKEWLLPLIITAIVSSVLVAGMVMIVMLDRPLMDIKYQCAGCE